MTFTPLSFSALRSVHMLTSVQVQSSTLEQRFFWFLFLAILFSVEYVTSCCRECVRCGRRGGRQVDGGMSLSQIIWVEMSSSYHLIWLDIYVFAFIFGVPQLLRTRPSYV